VQGRGVVLRLGVGPGSSRRFSDTGLLQCSAVPSPLLGPEDGQLQQPAPWEQLFSTGMLLVFSSKGSLARIRPLKHGRCYF